MQYGKIGQKIPTEMRSEYHCGGGVGLCHSLGASLYAVVSVGIRPVKILKAKPPRSDALAFEYRGVNLWSDIVFHVFLLF